VMKVTPPGSTASPASAGSCTGYGPRSATRRSPARPPPGSRCAPTGPGPTCTTCAIISPIPGSRTSTRDSSGGSPGPAWARCEKQSGTISALPDSTAPAMRRACCPPQPQDASTVLPAGSRPQHFPCGRPQTLPDDHRVVPRLPASAGSPAEQGLGPVTWRNPHMHNAEMSTLLPRISMHRMAYSLTAC
jgi:hypothetical protein